MARRWPHRVTLDLSEQAHTSLGEARYRDGVCIAERGWRGAAAVAQIDAHAGAVLAGGLLTPGVRVSVCSRGLRLR